MTYLATPYTAGFYAACSDAGFSKEAGLRELAKNLLMAGAIAGGGAGGGRAVGGWASHAMPAKAIERATELIEARKSAGKFVDADAFLARVAPKVERKSPEAFARYLAKESQKVNPELREFPTEDVAQYLLKGPDFSDYRAGTTAGFTPGFGVTSGRKADPSILAHEAAGHGSQKNLDPASENSFLGVLLGRQQEVEQDAWDRARKVYKVDPEVEDASMDTYRKAHAGAVGGGVAGLGLGAGGAALALLALSSLKRRR